MYPADIEPAYEEKTGLSSRVGRLNPWWNQKTIDIQARFHKAMEMTGSEFVDRVEYYAFAWIPARSLVIDALDQRFEVHPSGKILLFDQYCPWKEHLHTLEADAMLTPESEDLPFICYL